MIKNGKGLSSTHCCRITSILGLLSIASILPFQMVANVNIPSPIEEQMNISSVILPKMPSKKASESVLQTTGFHKRQYPRILLFDAETNSVTMPRLDSIQSLKPEKALKKSSSSSSTDEDYEPTCQPMHEWQTRTYPACNSVHEVNMRPESGSVVFINCGGSRCAFKILDNGDNWIVLKIHKYKKDIEERTFEKARKDGMAMERLQASPYVLDIFGFCGLSQIIEPGLDGGATHDLIKMTRLRGDGLSTVDKLKIVYQLASGVADMHTFENDGLVSLVHNDICCHQFIFVDGIYKLNDFHLAHFQTKNKSSNKVCKAYNGYSDHYKLIRSPEEISIKVNRPQNQNVLLEKSDVYTLGNVMYYILTMKWLFENQGVTKGIKELMQGRRSPFPERILSSSDRGIRAIRKAIEMCWKHNPVERPSADTVRNFLGKELKAVLGVEELGTVRVTSIDPLPEGYKYTDSDFRTMFYD